jgi:hypothetical protein
MSTSKVGDLDAKTKRRLIVHSALRITRTTIVLLVAYFLIPVTGLGRRSAIVALTLGAAAFLVTMSWQINKIVAADYPQLRAAESVGAALPIVVVVFAIVYESISNANATSFSQPLDHVAGLYFTVTVLSTVGFGDIVPNSDAARLVVAGQMVLDLVLIGTIVRLLFGAAQRAMDRPADEG